LGKKRKNSFIKRKRGKLKGNLKIEIFTKGAKKNHAELVRVRNKQWQITRGGEI
jgi:hypothetical protein